MENVNEIAAASFDTGVEIVYGPLVYRFPTK